LKINHKMKDFKPPGSPSLRQSRDASPNGRDQFEKKPGPSLLLTPLVKQGDVVILMGARDLRFSMLSQKIRNNL
jgi:hypothetical protein